MTNSKKEILLTEIKSAIASVDPDAKVILFGSRARGDSKEGSDWDLLVLSNKAINSKLDNEFRTVIYDIELEFEQVLSIFLFSLEKWNEGASPSPFYDNIRKEGFLL